MTSEWLKVMLDEIARKKAEAAQALEEQKRRAGERPLDLVAVVVESGECDPRKKNGDAE